jgi:hypothetical protein
MSRTGNRYTGYIPVRCVTLSSFAEPTRRAKQLRTLDVLLTIPYTMNYLTDLDGTSF